MPSFDPICPLPPIHTSFVNSPNIRSTLSIFWSSITILILCTWSILHLNVPIQALGPGDSNAVSNAKRILYLACMKTKWMVFALLAPEVLLGAAVADLLSAQTSVDDMREFAALDGVEWTIAHGFLANLGGFVVQFDTEGETDSTDPELGSSRENQLKKCHNLVENFSSETATKEEPNGDHATVAKGKRKLKPLEYLALKLDEEVREDLGYGRVAITPVIPSAATEKTFSSLDLIWAPRRQKRNFDKWMGLSALSRRNLSRPWNIGPTMDWSVQPTNQAQILRTLTLLKCTPKESIIPLYLNLAALQGNIWVLDARQLYLARKWGLIKLPNVREAELYDKSKSDTLIKLIALGQIIWLAIKLIARRIHGHPSTQLEIMTLAFAVCTSVTYLLLLRKPQDVKFPITIRAKGTPIPTQLLTLANFGPLVWFDAILFERWTSGRTNFWIPNTACHFVSRESFLGIRLRRYGAFWLGSAAGALLLGAFHALAWDVVFPSPAERILWRVASVLTAAIPWIYLVLGNIALGMFLVCAIGTKGRVRDFGGDINAILMKFPRRLRTFVNIYYALLSFIALLLYSLVRLFVLVEVFRSLAYLPPEAYLATFAS